MKKILITLMVLFVVATTTAQEQFSRVFNTVVVYDVETKTETEETDLVTFTFNVGGQNTIKIEAGEFLMTLHAVDVVETLTDSNGLEFQYGKYQVVGDFENTWEVFVYSNVVVIGLRGKIGIGFYTR